MLTKNQSFATSNALDKLARRLSAVKMSTQGPREGEVNDQGLVFSNHRWRREEKAPQSPDMGKRLYKKGSCSIHGLQVVIESPKGSIRSGVDADGKAWSVTMANHYGFIRGTNGADDDQVDVFIGPDPDSEMVVVINQSDQDTDVFDEHKIMLGWTTATDAVTAYRNNYEAAFLREELAELEAARKSAAADDPRKNNRAVKTLETAKQKLEARIQKALDKKHSDEAIFFEETGIDQLFVDESHYFKSLPVYTKMNRVKGVPSGTSERATNMLMRTRWLMDQNGGRGVVFATGTPIDNTMAELYNNMKYLQPEELKERGVYSFDDWASTFGEISTRHEFTVAGEYKPTTRFSNFTNVGNLMNITRQMMDVRKIDDMTKLNEKGETVPAIKRPNRRDFPIVSPKSEAITNLMDDLAKRAEAVKERRGPAKKGDDNMLVICTDGRKGALDMRLLDDNAPDDPNSKTNKCVNKVLELHRARPDQAQLIFSDLGVNVQKKSSRTENASENNEMDDVGLGSKGKFRLYDDVIDKLVAGGIPRDQIADFSQLKGIKKQEAMARIRKGEIKVAIGGTKKLGTGTNVQNKIMAMHHLDVPWTPAAVEQRDGRGYRYKNSNENIDIYRYLTEGSLDAKFWSIISTKARFTNQVMTSADRDVNDIKEEDTEVLSPEHLMAIASGDRRILDLIDTEDSIKRLHAAGSRHRRQQQSFVKAIEGQAKVAAEKRRRIKAYEQDAGHLDELPDFSVRIGDKIHTSHKTSEEALASIANEADAKWERTRRRWMPSPATTTIGQYRGMELARVTDQSGGFYTLTGPSGETYQTGDSLRSIDYVARHIGNKAADLRQELERDEQEIESIKSKLGKPFSGEAELEKLQARRKKINDAIAGRSESQSRPTKQMTLFGRPITVVSKDMLLEAAMDLWYRGEATSDDMDYIAGAA